jgi:hypothetical protein
MGKTNIFLPTFYDNERHILLANRDFYPISKSGR